MQTTKLTPEQSLDDYVRMKRAEKFRQAMKANEGRPFSKAESRRYWAKVRELSEKLGTLKQSLLSVEVSQLEETARRYSDKRAAELDAIRHRSDTCCVLIFSAVETGIHLSENYLHKRCLKISR